MGKTDSKKISRTSTKTPGHALSKTAPGEAVGENSKDENRLNRIALNDNMSLTLGQGTKKMLSFKMRF